MFSFFHLMYRRLQLAVHAHDKNMFCRPIKIQSFENQTSKFICPLWNFLAPLHKLLKGSKVDQQCIRAFCVWSFENQWEWMKLLFLIWMPIQPSTKNHWLTFCHLAGANCVILFIAFLHVINSLDQYFQVPRKAASFILAEVSSSSFRLKFALSHLDFSCLFSFMNLSHALSNLRLLVGEETLLVFSLYSMFTHFGTQYSDCLYPMWRPFFVQEISNLIRGFACNCCVDVVWCFTPIYSQVFLPKNHVQDWSFVAFRLQSRFREKMKIFCHIQRRECRGEHFFP